MTILDADFLAWTRSARRRPVELVEFNVTDETEAPKVLRVATRRYTTATHVYRGHRVDFELDWEMEPDVAGYSEPHLAHQQIVVHSVEALLQIGVDHPAIAVGRVRSRRLYRLMGTPARSKPLARLAEPRLKQGPKHLMQRLLDQSIRKRRDAECPHSARGLGMSIRRTGCGTYFPASSLALIVGQ